jgi:hypothetical protein
LLVVFSVCLAVVIFSIFLTSGFDFWILDASIILFSGLYQFNIFNTHTRNVIFSSREFLVFEYASSKVSNIVIYSLMSSHFFINSNALFLVKNSNSLKNNLIFFQSDVFLSNISNTLLSLLKSFFKNICSVSSSTISSFSTIFS